MKDLDLVPDFAYAPPKGVQFIPPPMHLIGSINASIDKAVAALGETPGKNVAIVAVADLAGANAAIVVKIGDTWKVKAYAGKEWRGPAVAGAEVLALF